MTFFNIKFTYKSTTKTGRWRGSCFVGERINILRFLYFYTIYNGFVYFTGFHSQSGISWECELVGEKLEKSNDFNIELFYLHYM